MPDGSKAAERPYRARGWCWFEMSSASVLTYPFAMLDVGQMNVEQLSSHSRWGEGGRSKRTPPLLPSRFDEVMATLTFTNGKEDQDLVCDLYRAGFEEMLSSATTLSFGDAGWGDEQMMQLAEVLRYCTQLRRLEVNDNPVGDIGLGAIVKALPATVCELDCRNTRTAAVVGTARLALSRNEVLAVGAALEPFASVGAVVARLDDSDWRVRSAALQALGMLEATALAQHAEAVVARLEDSVEHVREAAVETLGKLEAAALAGHAEAVLARQNDSQRVVRHVAREVMGKLTGSAGQA